MIIIENIKPEDQIPEIGDLAYNEHGALGVITGKITESLSNVTGFEKSKTMIIAYSGYHVHDNDHAPKGSSWSSINPRVVGCVSDAMAFVGTLKE